MSLEIKGTIHLIQDTEQINDTFKKRVFILNVTEGPYTQYPPFELIGDKVELIEKFKPNQEVIVKFNLRGREYNGKYYGSLQAWSVRSVEAVNKENQKPVNHPPEDNSDSLPF